MTSYEGEFDQQSQESSESRRRGDSDDGDYTVGQKLDRMKKRILNKKKKKTKKDDEFDLVGELDSGSDQDFKLMKKPKK